MHKYRLLDAYTMRSMAFIAITIGGLALIAGWFVQPQGPVIVSLLTEETK